MKAREIGDAVRGFVRDTFLFGSDQGLSEDASFLQNGIVDSTGVMELVAHVEERYGITVEDDELVPDNFDSISKLAAYIGRKVGVNT
jgi:acyl carrier protein